MKVCITIDMDNYREYRSLVDPSGDEKGASFYFESIPRFLDLFDRYGVRATFFMVGRDSEHSGHRALVREIAERGHEVGNHSYTHPYNFRGLTTAEKCDEIDRADWAIADIIGERPVGFRAPSIDIDEETLTLLGERGYLYDSSVFPSLMVWAFMLYGKLFVKRADYQLGALRSIFAPSQPYLPSRTGLHRAVMANRSEPPHLLEIPFTVFPALGIPFYATLWRILGPRAFDFFARAFGTRRRALHFVFHLIDLVDLQGTSLGTALGRTPGLGVSFERRTRFAGRAIETMAQRGETVTLRELALLYRAEHGLGIEG